MHVSCCTFVLLLPKSGVEKLTRSSLTRRPRWPDDQVIGRNQVSGKKKAHKHKLFCPVGLGTNPGFSLFYQRVRPWDKPSLSLGQSRGWRAAQKVHVKKVYVPFSLASFSTLFWSFPPKTPPHLGIENSHKRVAMTISPLAAREGTSAPQWPNVKKCCRHLVPSSGVFVQSYAVLINEV